MNTRRLPVVPTGLVSAAAVAVLVCGCSTPELPLVEDTSPTPEPTVVTTTTSTPVAVSGGTITIGIDPLTAGFNPHLAGNRTEFVVGLADLVLPSPFVGGRMDTDLLVSAEQVAPRPGVAQSVRYILNPQAQWSDGTPVTGSDFIYLWRGITASPDAVGSAAYRAIQSISTSDGGLTVTVDFAHRIARWQELFNHLLPSHLLPQSPSQFGLVLADGIPASAGRYTVSSVDRLRGNVTVNRNDRFWGELPATTDTLNFVEIRDATTAASMLRAGQMSAADLTPGHTTAEELELIGGTTVATARGIGMQLNLSLSVTSPVLSDAGLRRAVTELIDADQVARLATGRTTMLSRPADPFGGPPAEPSGNDPDVPVDTTGPQPTVSPAETTGHRAGDSPPEKTPGESPAVTGLRLPINDNSNPTAQLVHRAVEAAGRPLVIAAEATDDTATAAASIIVDQLARAGVAATVVRATADTATGQLLPTGDADGYVSWQPVADSPNLLADRYLCPGPSVEDAVQVSPSSTAATLGVTPTGATTTTTGSGAPATTATATNRPTVTGSAATTPPATGTPATVSAGSSTGVGLPSADPSARPGGGRGRQAAGAHPRAGNLSGLCDPAMDREISTMLAGSSSFARLREKARQIEAEQVLTVALVADTRLWVKSGDIVGMDPFPPLGDTLLATAARWTTTQPEQQPSVFPVPGNEQ
ncbi:ABC transporter substrate-binding protein [Corynebacterium mendelii]|uniref:Solute-binding protein family 5 domain-containing protein n=1 Tax=Corynebacterium mendelii TaxID=2765362 RepID=A0A939E362_9CORY|nr:hypothetical protein [Corynebacterium mendelii]